MKGRLFSSKSRILAVLCCFVLSVATFLAGIFMLVGKDTARAETSLTHDGFYVENGAMLRYDEGTPAMRYAVSITKEQYNTYVSYYDASLAEGATSASEQAWNLYVQLAFNKRYGVDVQKALPMLNINLSDIHAYFADSANTKPYTKYAAVYLDEALEENPTKDKYQLYQMFAETEVYVNYIGLDIDGSVSSANQTDWVNTKGTMEFSKKVSTGALTKEATNRSARSIATSLISNGIDTGKISTQMKFLIVSTEANPTEEVTPTVQKDPAKLFYDNYVDAITITVGADKLGVDGVNVKNAYVNGHIASYAVDGDNVTVSGVDVKEPLTAGDVYSVNIDAGENVYSYNNVTDATEIFYSATGVARMQEVFALTGSEIFVNSKITTDTVTDGSTSYSCDFYNVDRGYYVLAEDIDFNGTYVSHDSTMKYSATYGNQFYINTPLYQMAGHFGFGGTFNGNGHSIKGFLARDLASDRFSKVSGVFGSLAYGAKIENVAFTNIGYCGSAGGMANGSHGVLANWAGGYEGYTDYVRIKYNGDPAIVVDNCYFSFDSAYYTLADNGTNAGKINSAKSSLGRGIIIKTAEGVSKFSNCVFQTYNSDPMGTVELSMDGGYGIIADRTSLFDDNYENCYMISAPKANGRVEPVFQYVSPWVYNYSSGAYVELGSDTIGAKSGATSAYDKTAHPFIYKPDNSKIVYAANDYAELGLSSDGTEVYTGVDGEGKSVVAIPDGENGYTANKTAYAYTNIYRYDSVNDMIFNNTQSIDGFNENWTKVGGAVAWGKDSIEGDLTVSIVPEPTLGATVGYEVLYDGTPVTATVEKSDGIDSGNGTFTVNKVGLQTITFSALGLSVTKEYDFDLDIALSNNHPEQGEVVTYTLTSGGAEVNGYVTIEGIDTEAIDTVNKTITFAEAGNYEITITAFGYSETFEINIVADLDYDNPVVFSANYSLVKDSESNAYGVPYIYSGKDLIQTSYLAIYQSVFADATELTGVYTLTDGERAEISPVKDGHYNLQANEGKTIKTQQMVLVGDKGTLTINNQEVITLVVTDEDGFRYIPSSTESRKGSYYLATDFDNRLVTDGWSETNPAHSKLSDAGIYNGSSIRAIGYSFGSTTKGWPNAASINADNGDAFHGLFDGLGHKISYLVGQGGGLLGIYESYNEVAPIIKNVHFENFYASRFIADGTTQECAVEGEYAGQTLKNTVYFMGDYANHGTPIFAGIEGDNYMDVSEDCTIRLESVIFEVKNLKAFVSKERYGFFQFDWSRKKTASYLSDRISLNNVVIEYNDALGNTGINDTQGQMKNNESAGFLFDGGMMQYTGNTIYNISKYQMQGVNNVYMIVKPTAKGRVASITGGYVPNAGQIIALAENDFDALIPEANVYDGFMNGETPVSYGFTIKTTATSAPTYNDVAYSYGTYGWGTNSSGRFEIVSTLNVEGFTYEMTTINNTGLSAGVSPTIFFAYQGVNRYDDYNALATAKGGTATVGSWMIASDGTISWNPVV